MFGDTIFLVTARRHGDKGPAVKVTAILQYGEDRTNSTSVEVTDEAVLKKFDAMCESAIKSVKEDLEQQARRDTLRSAHIAGEKGETL